MGATEFFARSATGGGRRCLYLQQTLLQAANAPDGSPAGMAACSGLGEEMLADVHTINGPLLQALARAGGFGPWQRCQLFVGAEAARGARSILHFDQYDNLFLQLAGTKRLCAPDCAKPTDRTARPPQPRARADRTALAPRPDRARALTAKSTQPWR
eukprot:1704355-Prymnesium_polylepis.2